MMYGTLLRNYEAVKEDYSLIRKRYDDLVSSHSAAVNKLEHSQVRRCFNLLYYFSGQVILFSDIINIFMQYDYPTLQA